MHNTYICSKKLDGLKHESLFAGYQHIMQTGGGGLGPHDVYTSYVEGPLFEGEEYPLEYDRMKHFY
jgi:hypothetical protein